jgi:predicted dehydrogenase
MDRLRVAVVGLGKMGLLHASLLNVMPNVQLAALCDKSWLMRKLAKSTLDGPLVTDKLDKMSDLALDAVYVTTPIPSHYSIVRDVCEKNIAANLFVEKTLALNPAQSAELCSLSQNSNGTTMVGYMKRFSVTFKKAKELLDQRALGDLLSFDAYAYSSDFCGVEKGSVSGARGGVLEDLGSHVTDLALWFFGELHASSAKILSSSNLGSADSINFEADGTNGLKGKFEVSWVKEGYRIPEFGVAIKGSNGVLRVDDSELEFALNDAQPKRWYRQDLDDHVFFFLGDSEYFREDEHFIASIIHGDKSKPNFETAAEVDRLLEEVRCKANE